jgi:hypothetical protein
LRPFKRVGKGHIAAFAGILVKELFSKEEWKVHVKKGALLFTHSPIPGCILVTFKISHGI